MNGIQQIVIERLNQEVQSEADSRVLADVGERLIDTVMRDEGIAAILDGKYQATGKATPLKDALKAHYDSLKPKKSGNMVAFTFEEVMAFVCERLGIPAIGESRPEQPQQAVKRHFRRLELDADALLG
jgi:hypothetical protein